MVQYCFFFVMIPHCDFNSSFNFGSGLRFAHVDVGRSAHHLGRIRKPRIGAALPRMYLRVILSQARRPPPSHELVKADIIAMPVAASAIHHLDSIPIEPAWRIPSLVMVNHLG
jgi:hypothetical protein